MDYLLSLPVWATALVIFWFRVIDVALGTLRTIMVVQGKIALSVGLGFFEIIIWITAVSQVLKGIETNPLLIMAYACGFAAGNAVGIVIDQYLAVGTVEVRIISMKVGDAIARSLRRHGWRLTTFQGEGRDGLHTMIYAICARRDLGRLLEIAKKVDPNIIYSVDPVHEYTERIAQPLPHATGWRAVFKKK